MFVCLFYQPLTSQALLSVHDTVAQKNYDPVLPPMPDDIDDEEDSVKIIRLVKNREPLVSFGLHFVLRSE